MGAWFRRFGPAHWSGILHNCAVTMGRMGSVEGVEGTTIVYNTLGKPRLVFFLKQIVDCLAEKLLDAAVFLQGDSA